MRLGIVTDIHSAPAGTPDGAWHGPVRFSRALPRLDAALAWLGGQDLDALLVLGDLTNDSEDCLAPVRERVDRVDVPARMVLGGNHDDAFLDRLPVAAPRRMDGATLAAVRLRHLGEWSFSAGLPALPSDGLAVVATHFPLLSRAASFADRGLKYAGDLTNADETAAALQGRAAPTVVLGGHLHWPDAVTDGSVLQLVLPPLVEGEGWASLVEITAGSEPAVSVASRAMDGDGMSRSGWSFVDGAWRVATPDVHDPAAVSSSSSANDPYDGRPSNA